jgi:hypothetical protein
MSDSDRESVLGLEKSYFELRRKVCTKQMLMKDFFQQEVIIIIKLYLSIIFNGFSVLSFYCIAVNIKFSLTIFKDDAGNVFPRIADVSPNMLFVACQSSII